MRVETSGRLYRFAGALEGLLAAPDAEAFERAWEVAHVDRLAWEALGCARRADSEVLEPALDQVDRRLLATLERCRAFPDPHVVAFRVPELERWQHAAAAALVGARWGVAGLRTVIADTGAPLGRRYFAFLALAERHPEGAWPLFERYLVTPGAHHAFVAAAVEAARYYPGHADVLVRLFERIRGDQLLRRFLGPKILESPELFPFRPPSHVVGVVVARAVDQHDFHRAGRRGRHRHAHRRRGEPVGGAVEQQDGTAHQPDVPEVVER